LLLTRKEAAELLRCSPEYISRLINAGELQAVQRVTSLPRGELADSCRFTPLTYGALGHSKSTD
jgi:hypothetical protein